MAADESISVEIKDGVDKGVARNISEIASQARTAYQNVDKLQRSLSRVKASPLAQLNNVVSTAQRQMQQAALSAQRLATETARTSAASANAATAQARLATATARTAQAETAATAAALRLEAAQARAAATQDRATAAQQRAAAATAAQTRQIAAQEVELERINGINDRFNAVMARSPKYQQAFTTQSRAVARQAGLTRHEMNNLAFQLNDVAVGFASGQKPMTIFMQQGAQIAQIFGTSGAGAGAIIRQLVGMLGTLVMRLGLVGVAVGAVLAPFALFTREFNKGVDSKKLVDDLKLTEDQLKKLKKSGEEMRITFGDTFKATFQVLGQYAQQYFKPVTDNLVKWWNQALNWITGAFSVWIRQQLGMWMALAGVIKAVWKDIPAAIEIAVKSAINNAINVVEFGINAISTALVNSPMGKLLGVDGPVQFKLPRLQLSADATAVKTDVQKAIVDGYKNADKIVTKFGQDVRARALKNAQDRLRKAAGEDDGKGGRKGGFDRAKELAAINAELDAQAKNMFVLATARDAANRADEIALRFAKEGQPLRQDEIDALRAKIQALNDAKEVQTQFDRIFNAVTGPQREYNASLAAADKLLKMGVISQAQYSAEVARAKDAYKSATDPLHAINKELDEQIKLLGMLGPQREIEQQILQAQNKAMQEGKVLRQDEINALREKLKLVQQLNIQAQIADDLQANSAAQRSINTQNRTQAAIGQVGNNGFTGGDAISQLSQDNPALKMTQEYTLSTVAAYQDMYAQIEELRQADLISDQSAMLAKFELFNQQSQQYLATAQGIFGNLAALRNSDNKKAAAIGKKAAIAQALINTYTGATAAFQSAATIPYVGWILAPVAAAAAIAAGMAQVQAIRSQNAGFKEGGYTGNIPTSSIAGPVHGKEYVFDAPSTARIGVGNLEALRSGRIPMGALAGEGGGQGFALDRSVREGDNVTNYNQTVNVTAPEGRNRRRTVDQTARAIRRESTKELVRSGG